MGRFANDLAKGKAFTRAQLRAERAAKKVAWPKVDGVDFKGVVMWCPLCYRELLRIPEGLQVTSQTQQRIVDDHRAVCMRKKLRLV